MASRGCTKGWRERKKKGNPNDEREERKGQPGFQARPVRSSAASLQREVGVQQITGKLQDKMVRDVCAACSKGPISHPSRTPSCAWPEAGRRHVAVVCCSACAHVHNSIQYILCVAVAGVCPHSADWGWWLDCVRREELKLWSGEEPRCPEAGPAGQVPQGTSALARSLGQGLLGCGGR